MAEKPRDATSRRAAAKKNDHVLARLDGRRIAVVLHQSSREFVHVGVARYFKDDELGDILSIGSGDPLEPNLIVAARQWRGRIRKDRKYGCDFVLVPAAASWDEDDAR